MGPGHFVSGLLRTAHKDTRPRKMGSGHFVSRIAPDRAQGDPTEEDGLGSLCVRIAPDRCGLTRTAHKDTRPRKMGSGHFVSRIAPDRAQGDPTEEDGLGSLCVRIAPDRCGLTRTAHKDTRPRKMGSGHFVSGLLRTVAD